MKSILKIAAIFVVAASPALLAQWPRYTPPAAVKRADGSIDLDAAVPRAADGKPDLSGVWEIIPASIARPSPAGAGEALRLRGRGAVPTPPLQRKDEAMAPRRPGGDAEPAAVGKPEVAAGRRWETLAEIFPEARRISRGRPIWSRSGWRTTARTIPTPIVCRWAWRR